MALERQITFQTNVINTIDGEINNFLKTNAIDPAGIQIVISDALGLKTATLSYGNREEIKAAYETQGRSYSQADEVTYCYVKDIIVPLNSSLDVEVNEFLANENISVISISRYFTAVNKGAFIFYINIKEQKEKAEEKKAEIEKAQEELAQKLAQSAVKDTELDSNDVVEKYSEMSKQSTDSVETKKADNQKSTVETEDSVTDNSAILEAKSKNKKFWKK